MARPARSPIPEGFEGCLPYLVVEGGARAIDFYARAFGAETRERYDGPDGAVMHVELRIGRALFMLADACPEMGCRAPGHFGGSPISLMVYVPDVDALCARAVAAGAEVLRPLADQFYGSRTVTLKDPFGHTWTFGTHKEDLTQAEIEQRMRAQGA